MSTTPYPTTEPPDWEPTDEGPTVLAGRPRRRFWSPATAVLLLVIVGGACFGAGVLVEKGQVSSTSAATGSGLAGLRARAFAAGAAGAGTGAASGTSAAAGAGRAGSGGALGGFGRFAGGGGTFGTVSTVSGSTLYVTEANGNTVKVDLTSATTVTKTEAASRKAVRPGDTVVIQGIPGAGGSIAASAVTDSGNRSGATGTSGGSSGGATSAQSAVNSLFGSGG